MIQESASQAGAQELCKDLLYSCTKNASFYSNLEVFAKIFMHKSQHLLSANLPEES